MSKVLYIKFTLLLAFCIISQYSILGQEKFELQGKVMLDRKYVKNAEVIVYLDGKIANQTTTNEYGSFSLSLLFQKSYVLQFKHPDYPVQKVIVSTKTENVQEVYSKSKVIVFPLSSKVSSVEGPTKEDAVTAFQINKTGMFVESNEVFSAKVEANEIKQVETENKIEEIKAEINMEIIKIPENASPEIKAKYESVDKKIDSLLNLAYTQYGIIIQTARLKSDEMLNNAYFKMPEILAEKSESSLKNDNSLKSELKRMAIDDKVFLESERVKAIKQKLNEINNKTNASKKDSLIYLEYSVQFKEEIVKSARLQLEIDKLNAKTHEDSIALQQRENAIYFAEIEIKEAKDKIQIQQMVIKQKNTVLFFAFSALLFFIILSLVVYKSFRDKKRINVILEKNNQEIANKNKKIIDSIRYAQTIQQAILPIKSNIDKHFESFVIFQPKDIVSGDFYWFDHFEFERKSIFAVVDCTGHGVPGAFMSMIGSRLLIEAVKEKGMSNPVQVLEEVDLLLRKALMQEETSNNDGMDMCVCSIEYLGDSKCRVDFAGAKRPIFYSDGDKGMQHIKGTVRGLGGKKRIREKALKPFEGHSLVLQKGDMIYLTTDGIFDLQSPNRKKFGRINFIDLIGQNYTKEMNTQKEALIDALHIHKGSEYQIDDITILGIRL